MDEQNLTRTLLKLSCELSACLGLTLHPQARWPSTGLLAVPVEGGEITGQFFSIDFENEEERFEAFNHELPEAIRQKGALAAVVIAPLLGDDGQEELFASAVSPWQVTSMRAEIRRGDSHLSLGPWQEFDPEIDAMPRAFKGWLIGVMNALLVSSQSRN